MCPLRRLARPALCLSEILIQSSAAPAASLLRPSSSRSLRALRRPHARTHSRSEIRRLHPAARQLGLMLARPSRSSYPKLPADCSLCLYRCIAPSTQRGFNQARLLAVEAIAALRKQNPEWHLTLAPATLMRLRPQRARPDSHLVSGDSMCAAHSEFPIHLS